MQGYILWASQKDWCGNSPTFWKKNAQGYTSCFENMQVYETYEEAANAASVNCYKQVIPVKLSDIMEYAITCTTFPNCEKALDKAQKEWLQYWEEK